MMFFEGCDRYVNGVHMKTRTCSNFEEVNLVCLFYIETDYSSIIVIKNIKKRITHE